MQLCIQCSTNISQYKCPNCRSRYCSVLCYKFHKEVCTSKICDPKPKENISIASSEVVNIGETYLLDDALKRKLACSILLKVYLKSSKLQEKIRSIDDHSDGERATKLRKFRLNDEEFENFVAILLTEIKH